MVETYKKSKAQNNTIILCHYPVTGRGLATSWSPIHGVLPTVPDGETEESQPCAPKAEQAPNCGSNEEEKNPVIII
jgi:Na+-transporting NADH:ubiquinone oxidoreductase subunit NqrC